MQEPGGHILDGEDELVSSTRLLKRADHIDLKLSEGLLQARHLHQRGGRRVRLVMTHHLARVTRPAVLRHVLAHAWPVVITGEALECLPRS